MSKKKKSVTTKPSRKKVTQKKFDSFDRLAKMTDTDWANAQNAAVGAVTNVVIQLALTDFYEEEEPFETAGLVVSQVLFDAVVEYRNRTLTEAEARISKRKLKELAL